jgi:acyl carrier protein
MWDGIDDAARDVASDVLRIFREICLLVPDAQIDVCRPLAEYSGWDSIRQIELIVRLERWFGVRLSEADLADATTVATVALAVAAVRGRR